MTGLRVGIAGLGLIGGSLARALMASGYRVSGYDRAAQPRHRGVIACRRLRDLRECDVVVLAAPPAANLGLLRQLATLAPNAVITDVGSVKGPVCAEAARLGLRHFVGGHPIAGNAGSGYRASDPALFRGQPWLLVGGSARALRTVRRLVRAAGARPVAIDAATHDRCLAFLSHLPQFVAWALAQAAQGDPVAARHLGLAGPGYRGMTRLAGSPRELWREVRQQNRSELARAATAFQGCLRRLLREAH